MELNIDICTRNPTCADVVCMSIILCYSHLAQTVPLLPPAIPLPGKFESFDLSWIFFCIDFYFLLCLFARIETLAANVRTCMACSSEWPMSQYYVGIHLIKRVILTYILMYTHRYIHVCPPHAFMAQHGTLCQRLHMHVINTSIYFQTRYDITTSRMSD